MPVKVYWALGKVKRLHGPLKKAFEILKAEISHYTDNETIL